MRQLNSKYGQWDREHLDSNILNVFYVVFYATEHTQKIFPSKGTTSFLASVVFPKRYPEKTGAVLSCLAGQVGVISDGRAVLEGIHAEVTKAGEESLNATWLLWPV